MRRGGVKGAEARAAGALRVEDMVEADLPQVMVIERVSFRAPWSLKTFREELTREWARLRVALEAVPPTAAGEVAGGRGAVLGYLLWWRVDNEAHVLNLATHPDARRRGVARALMDDCLREARDRDLTYLTLEVRRSNVAALKLYEGLGFKVVGVRPRYYVEENEDALVMELTRN